ncbi:MAG: CRISPR-associated endonuclease Cas2 [Nitratireductor sp.]
MSATRMLHVFTYDISNDKLRAKVSKQLESNAVRVQESVFEAQLTTTVANRIFDSLVRMVMPGDSIRMYALDRSVLEHCRVHGGAPVCESAGFHLL